MPILRPEYIEVHHRDDQKAFYLPIYTKSRRLHVDLIETTRENNRRLGCIWLRDHEVPSPKTDPRTGQVSWDGYTKHTLLFVRQVPAETVEIPTGAGRLVGWFLDDSRGRWLVFAPDAPPVESGEPKVSGQPHRSSAVHSESRAKRGEPRPAGKVSETNAS